MQHIWKAWHFFSLWLFWDGIQSSSRLVFFPLIRIHHPCRDFSSIKFGAWRHHLGKNCALTAWTLQFGGVAWIADEEMGGYCQILSLTTHTATRAKSFIIDLAVCSKPLSAPPLSCLASSWKTVLNKERKEVGSLENHWPFEFNTHWKEPALESNFQIYPCISPNFLVLIHLVDTTGFQ